MQSSREDHRLPWVICVTTVVKAVTDRVKVVLLVRLRAGRVEQLATGQTEKHALANNHHAIAPDLAIYPSLVTDPPAVDGKEDGAAAAAAVVRIPAMTVEV